MEEIKDEHSQPKISRKRKKELIRRLFGYLKPYRGVFIFLIFLQIFLAFLGVLPQILIGKTLDMLGGIEPQSGLYRTIRILYIPPNLRKIIIIVLVYVVVIFLMSIGSYWKNLWLHRTGAKIVLKMREDVFRHIQKLDQAQYLKIPVGTLVTRILHNTESLLVVFTYLIVDLSDAFALLVLYLVLMFVYSWQLTLFILIPITVIAIVSIIFRTVSRKIYRTTKKRDSEINAFLSENLSGIKITQIFNREEAKIEEFKKASKNLRKAHLRTVSVNSLFFPSIFFLSRMSEAMVFYLTIEKILKSEMTYGAAFTYFGFVSSFFMPIQTITNYFDIIQNALASAERIFGILDIKPEIKDSPDAIELTNFKGNIEFKNVWFKYKENEWVLKDVSFKVKPTETVAIVGPTGSGKTTILNLIVKNYLPQEGEILLDGININKLTTKSIRSQIGQMLQDVFLFNGTIYDNLTFGDSSISEEEVIKACKYVGAYAIVKKQEKGLMTIVKERGNNFSAGERQLLSFARAFLYKPKVMFLDEATANIDSETELVIQKSLEKISNTNTMLVVAHRLSTIKNSDKILMLIKGKIVEEGSHEELLKNKSYYYNLYKVQYENTVDLKKSAGLKPENK